MADDDLDEDFDPDAVEEEIDEEAIDDEVIDDEVIDEVIDEDLADDDALVETDELVVTEEEAGVVVEEPAAKTTTTTKKKADDEEDDDEELDPDDVEADLDTILKDRIAAAEEEEDEDELDEQPKPAVDAPDGVIPKRANEFMCPGCFLLVNRGQFGPEGKMQCPVGESDCPAIELLQQTNPKPKPARASRKR
jgi:hypothetical protein